VSPTVLLLIALGGVVLLLVLGLEFKVHPFVTLMTASVLVALVGGISPRDLVTTIELGMGAVLGHVAIIIAPGAMIGRVIELSGGAQPLAPP
jgi:gluconate:H+ symporter, GntP family